MTVSRMDLTTSMRSMAVIYGFHQRTERQRPLDLETGKVSYAALGRTIELAAVEKLLGGSGADTFSLKDGASHEGSLDGGDGIDLLDYSLYTTAVSVNLSDGSSTGISGSISGFENVTGGSGDDHITGDSKNNVIIGGPGNDTIYGQAGHDTLIGGTGDDVLYGGAGNDTYRFEDNWGSDSIIESDGEGNSILIWLLSLQTLPLL